MTNDPAPHRVIVCQEKQFTLSCEVGDIKDYNAVHSWTNYQKGGLLRPSFHHQEPRCHDQNVLCVFFIQRRSELWLFLQKGKFQWVRFMWILRIMLLEFLTLRCCRKFNCSKVSYASSASFSGWSTVSVSCGESSTLERASRPRAVC